MKPHDTALLNRVMTYNDCAQLDKPALDDGVGIDFGGARPSKPDVCQVCMQHIRKNNSIPPWSWGRLRVPVVPNCMRKLSRVE